MYESLGYLSICLGKKLGKLGQIKKCCFSDTGLTVFLTELQIQNNLNKQKIRTSDTDQNLVRKKHCGGQDEFVLAVHYLLDHRAGGRAEKRPF